MSLSARLQGGVDRFDTTVLDPLCFVTPVYYNLGLILVVMEMICISYDNTALSKVTEC